MFEELMPDKGEQGLTKAARIFYVISVLAGLAFILNLALLATGSRVTIFYLSQLAVTGALALVTGRGIEAQRPWAKWLGYIQGFLTLFNFPIGTVVGVAVLIYISRASKAGLFRQIPTTAADPM